MSTLTKEQNRQRAGVHRVLQEKLALAEAAVDSFEIDWAAANGIADGARVSTSPFTAPGTIEIDTIRVNPGNGRVLFHVSGQLVRKSDGQLSHKRGIATIEVVL